MAPGRATCAGCLRVASMYDPAAVAPTSRAGARTVGNLAVLALAPRWHVKNLVGFLIQARNFDLKAVNLNAKVEQDHRARRSRHSSQISRCSSAGTVDAAFRRPCVPRHRGGGDLTLHHKVVSLSVSHGDRANRANRTR